MTAIIRREFLAMSCAVPMLGLAGAGAGAAAALGESSLAAGAAEFSGLGAPGAALMRVEGDGDPAFLAVGVEDLTRRNPVTTSTIFQIASLTKPFTAMIILMLAEEGRLAIDDQVRKHLAWLPDTYQEVTIRQLLNHTSGVPRDLRRANVDEFDIAEFKTRFLAAPKSFAPGEKWEYANAGYTLLTLVAEQVTSRSFGELLEQRIFAPLAMKSSSYRAPLLDRTGRATGYDWEGNSFRPAARVYSGWGGSGIETSMADLAAFAQALQRRRLLRPESYEQMLASASLRGGDRLEFQFRDAPTSYGFGWFLTAACGKKLAFHGGALAGFSSSLQWVIDDNLLVAALSNGKSGPDRFGIAEKLAAPILRRELDCSVTS